MRKIRIIEHISLDGVIQASGGTGEDGDYPYGGAGQRPRTRHRRGRSLHQGEGRAGPDRLGQLDADTGAARTPAR